MDTSSVSHFAALSFIVAPAMLTNASAVMGLSSSNRLAIATQRTRELAHELEAAETLSSDEAKRYFAEMSSSAERSELLIRALRQREARARNLRAKAAAWARRNAAKSVFDPGLNKLSQKRRLEQGARASRPFSVRWHPRGL
ncbi:MAG: hypothetical protein ACKOJB_00895, partial [Chthoniobacterales bacterium]